MPFSILSGSSEFSKWYNLIRQIRTACDNAGIAYTLGANLTDIRRGDSYGEKWEKLSAWMELLATNIGGGGGGSGDVVGPAGATADHLAVFDGVTGKLIKDGGAVPGGGGGALLTATVELNDAQIKALPTTPVQIVPAPGAGKIIQFVVGTWRLNTLGGAYTNIDGEESRITFRINGRIISKYEEISLGLLSYEDDSYVQFTPLQEVDSSTGAKSPGTIAQLENQALSLQGTNDFPSADFTGGHASNTLKVTVWYVEVDV